MILDGYVEDCPHCVRLSKNARSRLPESVWETDSVLVIAGAHQFYRGYCVVISKVHIREMHHLNEELASHMFLDVLKVGKSIERHFKCFKINYVSLGNVDEHLHWHVIPRYEGDVHLKQHPWSNEPHFSNFLTSEQNIDELKSVFT
jgi:diadenosine tetraphosphate (Ap4A) HIT family hydrolase